MRRNRLEDYESSCGYDRRIGGCPSNKRCRLAVLRSLGTVITTKLESRLFLVVLCLLSNVPVSIVGIFEVFIATFCSWSWNSLDNQARIKPFSCFRLCLVLFLLLFLACLLSFFLSFFFRTFLSPLLAFFEVSKLFLVLEQSWRQTVRVLLTICRTSNDCAAPAPFNG